MGSDIRVGSLNLRAMPNPDSNQIHRLTRIIAEQDLDVVLLQECRRPWLQVVCDETGMTGIHSHLLQPHTPSEEFSPDGCAIAVRSSIQVVNSWRIPPASFMPEVVQREIFEEPPEGFQPMPERLAYRYSGRSVLAEITLDDQPVVVASFHGTPGSGRVGGVKVHEWKPFYPGAVAIELAAIERPFVFGIDANEPLAETPDSVTFHWADDRSGVRKTQVLLGLQPIHRGRDLFREWLAESGRAPASADVLLPTYAPSHDLQRRFDSLWATPEFSLASFETRFDEVVAAGGDHAILIADLRLS